MLSEGKTLSAGGLPLGGLLSGVGVEVGVEVWGDSTLVSGGSGVGSGVSTEGFVTTATGGGGEEGTGVGAGGCGTGEAGAAGGRSPSWPDIALWVWQLRQSHSFCKTKKKKLSFIKNVE